MQTIVAVFFMMIGSGVFAQTATSAYGGGYGYATPPNPAENCISDICGAPPQSNLYMTKYFDRVAEYTQSSSDPKQIDFPPSTSKLFSDLLAETNKQNEFAASLFKRSTDMGSAQLSGVSKPLYNMVYAAPFLKKIKYKASKVNGKMIMTVDEAASMSELKDLSPEERSWVLQVAKSFNTEYADSPLSDDDIRSQPAGLLLKKLHSGNSVESAMKIELNQVQTSMASLKNLSPLEKALFFSGSPPDRIALIAAHVAQGTVDENETREIIRWNQNYKFVNNRFRNANSPLMKRPTPRVEEIIKKGGGVDTIAKSYSEDRAMEHQKDEGKLESCKLQYFLNKGLLPNKDQVNTLKKDIARSKQMVEEMIKAKFPSSMQQKLIKAVEAADFVMPPTAAEFETSFAENIRQKLEAKKATSSALNSVSTQDMRQMVSVYSLLKSIRDPNEIDNSNEFCDAFNYSPMSDGNYTTYGSIVLSFTTATGDETSRLKTLMHELGHSVSKAIADDPQSSAQLLSVRKCLAEQHSEELPPQTKKSYEDAKAADPKTNGPYLEEDFADTVAGQSGTGVKGRNSWCQFMTLTYDRQQYQESKMQAADGDPHSSSLFRLLNFEMMKKGNVPDSCKSYYKAAQYTEHFSSCFDLAKPHGSSTQTSPARAVH